MALSIQWYDVVCGGIVGFSAIASIWVIWRKEGGSRVDDNKLYLSLLSGGRDGEGHVVGKPVGHVDSSWLWTSCWRGVHPGWLLMVRLGSLAAMGTFLAWDIVEWDASIFVYYTEWTFTLVMFYFALGSFVSAYGCWVHAKKPSSKGDLEGYSSTNPTYRDKEFPGRSRYTEEDILQRAGFWGYIMQIAYQTSAGAVILTDIVFWCVIVPFMSNARLGLNLLMGCMHTMNALFLLIDMSLNNLPFPWFRLAYFVLWTCIYVVFQWLIHACGFSWWPYPFLDLSSGWCSLWYLAVAVLHIPCYGAYAVIIKAKNSTFSKLFPQAFGWSY